MFFKSSINSDLLILKIKLYIISIFFLSSGDHFGNLADLKWLTDGYFTSWLFREWSNRWNWSSLVAVISDLQIFVRHTTRAQLLDNGAELEALQGRQPDIFKFLAETIALIDNLDHDDRVSDKELLDQTGSFYFGMGHQQHDHYLDLIYEWEEVKDPGCVVQHWVKYPVCSPMGELRIVGLLSTVLGEEE